jgi:hypothetical protein
LKKSNQKTFAPGLPGGFNAVHSGAEVFAELFLKSDRLLTSPSGYNRATNHD